MVFFEQFRLPILFMISGTGTVFAFSKRTWIQSIKERASRLVVPLVFWVFIIVPPQTYIENINFYTSFMDFYKQILSFIEVHHLWFIENFFYLSLVSILLFLFIRSIASDVFKKAIDHFFAKPIGVMAFVIPLILLKMNSKKFYPPMIPISPMYPLPYCMDISLLQG